jgi:inositol-phosphate transport system substrate-binding protein
MNLTLKRSVCFVSILISFSGLSCTSSGDKAPEKAEGKVEVEVPSVGKLVTLVARCKARPPTEERRCNNLLEAVEAANAELAARGHSRRVMIEVIQDDKPWADYKTEFELASDANEAPDIIVSGHEHIGDWASAGLIIPLTRLLRDHPEFDDVLESIWNATEWKGERWGAPQDADARPLYYSKTLLRKLGWSDEQIDSLPGRIGRGEFTLKDMLVVAEQAVRSAIVRSGNGWWHRPKNGPDFLYYYLAQGGEIVTSNDALVFDTKAALAVYQMLYSASQERGILSSTLLGMEWNEWNSALSSTNKVLFWFGGSWNWADWAANYVRDRGGDDFLFENIGFAPIPAGRMGKPITLTHPVVYMISSQCKNPELAILVIAKASTKELNSPYAVESGHLGILKSQQGYDPYTRNKFLNEVTYLLDFTTFLPNSPHWSSWSEAFFLGIQAVESGDLSPDEALEVVADRLENELGENVVIR